MDSVQFSEALPPVIQLRPYQQRWIDDDTRFKGAVKSARIGYSYGTGVEAILDCLAHEATNWTILSAAKHQALEFIEQASKNIQAIGAVADLSQEPYADELGATEIQVQIIRFANGSRMRALPSNPRTARGYPGNAILDEFAHHEDSYAIFAAIARQVALGHKLRVLSTANGEQGKFFDLAKEFGLVDGAPAPNPVLRDDWSWHWVDVYMAIQEGCPIDLQAMRNLFKDAEMFGQEFECVFLKSVGSYIALELIAQAEDDGATTEWPADYTPVGPLFAGIDVARDRDAPILWIDEYLGDVAWTRMVLALYAMPFFADEGKPCQASMLLPWVEMCTRTAMDMTGLGVGLYDWLNMKVPGRVMGLNFAGTNDQGVRIKTDLATRLKGRLEKRLERLPRDPHVRQELQAIKKEVSGGGVKFDAPRIEVDTPVAGGKKLKRYAHADRFWAKAMAAFAAAGAPPSAFASIEPQHERVQRGILSKVAQEIAGQPSQQPEMRRERRTLWG